MKYEDSGDNSLGFTPDNDNEGTALATVMINGYSDGVIEVQPVVSRIPVRTVVFEDNNGKISSNNGRLDYLDGEQVKLADVKKDISNVISFSPDSAYEFLKWEVYNRKNGDVYDNGTYIQIDDEKVENTSYTLINVPEEDVQEAERTIQLAIRPIVAERPQILDYAPSGAALLRKDSTIQIIFDYDLSENSIYYTKNELKTIR